MIDVAGYQDVPVGHRHGSNENVHVTHRPASLLEASRYPSEDPGCGIIKIEDFEICQECLDRCLFALRIPGPLYADPQFGHGESGGDDLFPGTNQSTQALGRIRLSAGTSTT
jgi:hypothetical protein